MCLLLTALLLSLVIIATFFLDGWCRRPKYPYPPGPKPKFLIGNLLDIPMNNSAQMFSDWSKKYNSGMVFASIFGLRMLIINDLKIAEDMMEKRARIYNDRPQTPMIKFTSWDRNLVLMRYGDYWRQHRKICHQNFHADVAKKYYPIHLGQVEVFLKKVLREPERVFDHLVLLSISSSMLMMYGYAPKDTGDSVVQAAEESSRLANALFDLSGTLINVLPILYHVPSWVPGTKGKRMIEKTRQLTQEARLLPVKHVAAAMKSGTASSSLVTELLERKATIGVSPDEEEIITNVAWTVYGAASDTTISATGSFLYLILGHPEVQRKAQEEIDRVIGGNRLPNFDDRPDLPYIDAVYHEVMRHSPPIALSVPHSVTEDDIYEGYLIPKGVTIITNIWAMSRDETVYPDPSAFKPERFIDAEGKLKDSRILAYGFGRRICAGKYVANNFIWLVIASFFACFNIDKAVDENGKEVWVDGTYTRGIISRKRPFKCSITPRSSKVCGIIEESPCAERHR